MTKDIFQGVLREFEIMERNEIFADNFVDLDEFSNCLKNYDVEFMELPEDHAGLTHFKMVQCTS